MLLAGLIVALATDAPLALVSANFAPADWARLDAFAALIVILYGWMIGRPPCAGMQKKNLFAELLARSRIEATRGSDCCIFG